MSKLLFQTPPKGFSDWLFLQGPSLVIAVGTIAGLWWIYNTSKKEAKEREVTAGLKFDKISEDKDKLFERFYNAMTEWHVAIKESVKATDVNTESVNGTGSKIDKVLMEMSLLKKDLEDLKTKMNEKVN